MVEKWRKSDDLGVDLILLYAYIMPMNEISLEKINRRYSILATSTCCLSCGGAVGHAKAKVGEVCVDLGCGRGTDALRLADSVGSGGMVVGIDIAEGMIEKARNTAQKLGAKNARFEKAVLESLPLESDFADLVISNCVLNHANDKSKVWSEIFRILKPGGRFVISDIFSTEPVPPEYRNDPEAVAECWAGSDTREVYTQTIYRAGFADFQILEESAPYDKGKVQVCSWTITSFKPNLNKE